MERRRNKDGTGEDLPPLVEAAVDEQNEGGSEELESTGWQERLADVKNLGCRITKFHALSGEPRGLFRVVPVAVRLLRLAGGRTQEAIGVALGVEIGTVEAIERGCVHPTLRDVDTWTKACDADLEDFFESMVVTQHLWPPALPILTLPQFWGPVAPSPDDFETARQLIEGLSGGGNAEPSRTDARGQVGKRLARFFEYLDEDVSPHLASMAPRAGLEELRGDEPFAVASWWSRTLALWFNLYLVCQAPIGCRFLNVEPNAES